MPLYIFIFATMVEVLQYFNIVTILGLENNVFDIKDIVCYGVGCALLGIYECKKQ